MGLPIPVGMQAKRLKKYGIDEELLPAFNDIRDKCKTMAIYIKQDKLTVGILEDQVKADELKLASKGVTLNLAEILKKRATKKEIKAKKN